MSATPTSPNAGMRISAAGLDLTKHFESCFLRAYQDGGGVWTIGWGHTGLKHQDGTVKRGRVITRAEADQLLEYDMHNHTVDIFKYVTIELAQNEFDALVSWNFNTGGLMIRGRNGKMGPSTLLKKLNAGDLQGAADEFLKWNKDNGKRVDGLTRRRLAEREMFLHRPWTTYQGADWKKRIPPNLKYLIA
jgi:lysozyme